MQQIAAFVYDYFLKDHLGNTRMVITDDYNVASPILEASSYYPFGLEQKGIGLQASVLPNKYKFNGGTELNTDFNVNLYETTFRSLDPQLGRFWQNDPLTEETSDVSPFAFVVNNPVMLIDPMGLDTSGYLTPVQVFSDPEYWTNIEGGSDDTYTGTDLLKKPRGLQSLPGFDGTYNTLSDISVSAKAKPKRINWWNTSFMRSLIKDSYSINITGSANALFGGVQGTFGINWLTRGQDASFWPYITIGGGSQTNAISIDASLSGSLTSGSFRGSISDLNQNFFIGTSANVGGAFGLDDGAKFMAGASRGWGIGKSIYADYHTIGVSFGAGLGTNVQVNGSVTNTPAVIRLDRLLSLLPNSMIGDYYHF